MARQKHNTKITSKSIEQSGLPSDYRKAIAEYIWNGFDAKATQIDIDYTSNEIGHIFNFSITDNGEGIRLDTIDETFGHFLDSHKKDTFNKDGFVKGKMGKGRFAFSLFANKAIWQTRYRDDDKILQYDIEISRTSQDTFSTDNKIVSKDTTYQTGTKVIFDDIHSLTSDLLDSEQFEYYLCGEFGWFLFLNKDKDYSIRINGEKIDYWKIIEEFDEFDRKFGEHTFAIKFLRWNEKIGDKYYYYFLNEEKKENHRKHTSFNNKSNDFHHSVYIEAPFFNEFTLTKDDNPVLGFSGKNQSDIKYKKLLNELNKYVFEKEKQFIREKQAEKLIEKYYSKKIFPTFGNSTYAQYRQKDLEVVVKEIYCIQPKIFQGLKDAQSKTLVGFLNLLLDTDQREHVLTIIENVIQLTDTERELLAKSLQKTNFSQITELITLLEQRHNVVSILKSLVFDHEKFTTERDHIQKVIENNYWLFGEQYHLVSADKNFETTLNNYLFYIENGQNIPQRIDDKNRLKRPDIFTCRQNNIPDANSNEYTIEENIIVELKRPNIVIGKDQYSQIEDYLIFIKDEPRFNSQLRKWKFILIGKEVDSFIKNKYDSQKIKGKRFLVEEIQNYEIYAMTWDDVFRVFENRHAHLINKLEFKDSVLEELGDKGILFTNVAPDKLVEQTIFIPKDEVPF